MTELTWWQTLVQKVHLAFVYFISWLVDPTPPLNRLEHGICILGDDFAFGYGDGTYQAGYGVSGRLPVLMAKEKAIRQQWSVYNRGYISSTSADWVGPPPPSGGLGEGILSRIMADPRVQACEIFLILLGANDDSSPEATLTTPEATLHNIRTLAKAILHMPWPTSGPRQDTGTPRSIYICSIPTSGDVRVLGEEAAARNARRNALIKQWLSSNVDNVHPGPEIDNSNFEYDRADLFASDGRLFSKRGYINISKDFLSLCHTDIVKREFATFCAYTRENQKG